MKRTVFLIISLSIITGSACAQKTTRETVSKIRGITITKVITEADTLFMLMGQNSKYTHITDIIAIKSGTARDINMLLSQCMIFIPEKKGTSLDYEGNTILATGGSQIMLYGSGYDDRGYILLNKGAITKLQTDLQAHL